MVQVARGVCLFGHEHDGPQTCVAPIESVSREWLAQAWKATFFDFPEPLMTEQLVNVPEILVEVATPSSETEPLATTHTGAQNLGNAASAKNEVLSGGLVLATFRSDPPPSPEKRSIFARTPSPCL